MSVLVPVKQDREDVFVSLISPAYWEADPLEVLTTEATPTGPGAAWNSLAARAKGDFVFIGADDILVSRRIFEIMLKEVREEDDILAVSFVELDHRCLSRPLMDMTPHPSRAWTVDDLMRGNFVGIFAVRRSKFLCFDESLSRYIDWVYLIRACKAGHRMAYTTSHCAVSLNLPGSRISEPDSTDAAMRVIRERYDPAFSPYLYNAN